MIIDEAKRCLHYSQEHDQKQQIIYGRGFEEILASLEVARYADLEAGIEKYAIREFSDAFEDIPTALAENSGFDTIETVTKIKAEMQADPSKRLGIDALWQGTNDMRELGVFESLASKVQQLQLATQVVRMILKIDDVFTPNEYE